MRAEGTGGYTPPAAFEIKRLTTLHATRRHIHSCIRPWGCWSAGPATFPHLHSGTPQVPWSAASPGSPLHLSCLTPSLHLSSPHPLSLVPTFGIAHTLQLLLSELQEAFLYPGQSLLQGWRAGSHHLSYNDTDLSSGPAGLEVCSLDQQHWLHLETC